MVDKLRATVVPLLCVLAFGDARTSPAAPAVPFVLTGLGLELEVDYRRSTIDGTATLHLRNVSDRPAAEIPLVLNRLMTVSRIIGNLGGSVRFEQRVTVFEDDSIRQVNAVVVSPERPVGPGDSVTIVVHYGGILVGYTETGSLYVRDHVSRDFTIIREDAYAFPSLGAPSWKARGAMVREPFAFTARVTVPAGLVVAMGGEPGDRVQRDSVTTWSYQSRDPVPFLNIAIAPYRVLEHAGVRIFYFPKDSAGARLIEGAVAGGLERYTRWYGSLGREGRLTVMEIPEGWGSQASLAAGVLQTADAFRDRSELRQLYHELSHLWNPPDLDRPSPRWNEGLATFLQWRMAGELDGWADWDAELERTRQGLLRRCAQQGRCDSVPFVEYGGAGLTTRAYSVGMLMFYALYQVLGAEAFDRAYRDFFQRSRAGGVTSAEMVAAFRGTDSASERIFAEWFLTTRWHARLTAGESMRQIVEGYRRR
jgi:hypothetical protein